LYSFILNEDKLPFQLKLIFIFSFILLSTETLSSRKKNVSGRKC